MDSSPLSGTFMAQIVVKKFGVSKKKRTFVVHFEEF